MRLTLPTSNFSSWKKYQNNYYFPANCDNDNHIHVRGNISNLHNTIEIHSVSIKINGNNTNLRPRTAIQGYKFDPNAAIFPTGLAKQEYMNALRSADVIA